MKLTRTAATSPSAPDLIPPGDYLNVRLAGSTDGVNIAGIANRTSTTDSYGTRFRFLDEALESFRRNPVLLLNHDPGNPVGTVTRIEVRGDDLYCEATVHPTARTITGAPVTDLVRDGVLKGFSIRFDPDGPAKRMNGYDLITVRRIPEISLTPLPSNEESLFNVRAREAGVRVYPLDPEERALLTTQELAALAREEAGRLGKTAEEILAEQARTEGTQPGKDEMPKPATRDLRNSRLRAAGPLSFSLLTARLCELAEAMSEERWDWVYCVAVYDDYCVMAYNWGSRFAKYPYTVDASGEVTLEPGVEVLPTWVEVGQTGPAEEPTEDTRAQPEVPDEAPVTLDDLRSALRNAFVR
jgi:HK97 family phage prohead protease